jgi:hypothetical protein
LQLRLPPSGGDLVTASTEVALRPSAQLVPARPIVAHAAALADQRITDVVEEFLRADEASREAFAALHLSQAAGSAVEDEAERLYGEAENAWKIVASGWARGMFVAKEVLDAGREYAVRPRVVNTAVPSSGDWRESVRATDWSRSGRDAA